MTDMQQREDLLRQDGYIIAIATLGLLNGMEFSPLYEGAYILLQPFWPSFLPKSAIVLFYLSSLILSVGTVMLGGVGAALYERAQGLSHSSTRSMQIWLLGTLALTLPTIGRMFGLM